MEKNILSNFLKENGGEIMSFLYDMLTKGMDAVLISELAGLSEEDISSLSQAAKLK